VPNTKAAVFIDGKGAGSISISARPRNARSQSRDRYQPTPQEQAQRKKEALAERVEKLSRVRVLEAIRKKLPDVLSARLEDGSTRLLPTFGPRQPPPFVQAVRMEGKKSKTSWGAETVDYEKIAAPAVQAMNAADVNRFLVVCALASDLYCPGYNPRQSLAKDSNLARTAARYKVDSTKIATTDWADLSSKMQIHRSKPHPGKRSPDAS